MGVTIFRPGQRVVIPSPGVQVWSPRAASAAASAILDGISNVAAAYSLRKLRSAYVGSAVRVRRSSDSTEQDIGFDGTGEFDSAAFSSFAGGGTGYVKTWYDQSGNGRNATQATAGNQPIIAPTAINSKPALQLVAASKLYLDSAGYNGESSLSGLTRFAVATTTSAAINQVLVSSAAASAAAQQSADALKYFYFVSGNYGYLSSNTLGPWVITNRFEGTVSGNSNRLRAYINGNPQTLTYNSTVGTITGSANGLNVGRPYATDAAYWNGYVAEIIVLSTAISAANHNTIGADTATRFGLSWTTVT